MIGSTVEDLWMKVVENLVLISCWPSKTQGSKRWMRIVWVMQKLS